MIFSNEKKKKGKKAKIKIINLDNDELSFRVKKLQIKHREEINLKKYCVKTR